MKKKTFLLLIIIAGLVALWWYKLRSSLAVPPIDDPYEDIRFQLGPYSTADYDKAGASVIVGHKLHGTGTTGRRSADQNALTSKVNQTVQAFHKGYDLNVDTWMLSSALWEDIMFFRDQFGDMAPLEVTTGQFLY